MNSLKEYKKKRNFKQTPEPLGRKEKTGLSRFVVQKHYARHLHYDFRLEMEGVLKSWAVPKGLPEKKGIRRLAVQVEDHPIDYLDFQGEIPQGCYGAGRVEIWDKGWYNLIEKEKDRKLVFELKGKKLKGVYELVLMKDKNWLIFKLSS